jgi:hypothetical protein
MQVNLDLRVRQVDLEATEIEKKGVREYARTIWSTITKYISYDKDAIFKDPKWPHLWS